MGFDKSKFLKAGFVPREAKVEVPALKDFFDDLKEGEKPVWKVRGLTGHEVAKIRQKLENKEKVQAIMRGLLGTKGEETEKAVRDLIGNNEETPHDAVYRLHLLEAASIDPECDIDLAGRILAFFGVTFYNITDTILVLCGRGHVPGKVKSSGTTPESGRD